MTLRDLRAVFRRLGKSPWFAGLAVVVFALGIGAHVAVLGLVDALFLDPLPFADVARLVGIYETRNGSGFLPLSLPDFRDYQERTTVFSDLAAHYPSAPLSLDVGERWEMVNGSVVSPGYFSVLGVEPARGRFFVADEGSGARPVAVVSYRLWQRALGGREDVVGTVIRVNATPLTVVGVAPEGFRGVFLSSPSEIWIPTGMSALGYRWCDPRDRECTWLTMIGRLAPGHTIAEAGAEMDSLSAAVREVHPPGGATEKGLTVAPLRGIHPGNQAAMIRLAGLLAGGVTLLLVIATVNLGGLLMARGHARRREAMMRLALGAPRRHVVGLFVAEAVVLAGAGGVVGLSIASWLGPFVSSVLPTGSALELAPDGAAVAYAVALSMAVGLVAGLISGIGTVRSRLTEAHGYAVAAGPRGRSRLLEYLVVAQVALSFVLLASTGLLARSLANGTRPGGIEPDRVATFRLRPRLVGYEPGRARAFHRQVVRRLSGLPGVESVSLSAGLPPFLFFSPVSVSRPGEPAGDELTAWTDEISPDLMATLGLKLLRGRDFDERDRIGSVPVAIVGDGLAETLWPDGDAIGERIVVDGESLRVVGVVDDVAIADAARPTVHRVYTAYWQDAANVDARLTVRTSGDAGPRLPMLRAEIRAVDPAIPISETGTLAGRLRDFLVPVHVAARVLGAAGGLALFVSSVGLAGLLALGVTQRRREMGIRSALGGTARRIQLHVVGQGMRLVAIALILGVAGALAVSRTLGHYLYGVTPNDPATLAGALVALILTAFVACLGPARRATRIDPMQVLREE